LNLRAYRSMDVLLATVGLLACRRFDEQTQTRRSL
jgi:hypothetical protein